MIGLASKVALVTGGGSGLGRAIAARLHAEGVKVAICGRNEARLRETTLALGADSHAAVADLTDTNACKALVGKTFERFGRLDILINNAGITGTHASCRELAPKDVEDCMRANFFGAYACLHFAVPHMIAMGGGSIVNIGSMTGKRPMALRVAYAASKMALLGMSRSAALDLAPHNIRCNVINPGPIKGERLKEAISASAEARGMSYEEGYDEAMAMMPLRNPVGAEQIAAMVAFLCSDDCRHITGEDIAMTSGIPVS